MATNANNNSYKILFMLQNNKHFKYSHVNIESTHTCIYKMFLSDHGHQLSSCLQAHHFVTSDETETHLHKEGIVWKWFYH